jgi:hypothetical protein
VAKQIAKSYADFYRDYEISGVSTDIAVCKLDAFRGPNSSLVGKFGELASLLTPKLEACHAKQLVQLALGMDLDLWDDRKKAGAAVLAQLAQEIAQKLHQPELVDSLMNGFANAKKMLAGPNSWKVQGEKGEPASAKTAVAELMQFLKPSFKHVYGREETPLGNMLENLHGMVPVPEKVEDPARALSIVRALRELDPGVQDTLAHIEKADADGAAEAKEARELLLTFHHIQRILELADFHVCTGGLTSNDRRLLDSLVAARWEAQSFKGGVYVDLFDFCGRIGEKQIPEVANLDKVTQAIRAAASAAVEDSHFTGADFQHAHGLSVYFPVTAEDYTPKYMNLQFAKETGWGRLVRAYLEATRRPRRYEDALWLSKEHIRRYNRAEIDPLHRDDIEARIIGIDESAAAGGTATKTGRGGNSNNARGGNSNSAKGGNSNSAKGKLAAVFGNPPDGFRRILSTESSKGTET